MASENSFAGRCPARAVLAGNPSDWFGGSVVAVPINDLRAMAVATSSDTFAVRSVDPYVYRVLRATGDAFVDHCGSLPNVRLSASTEIPIGVGLGGSSAIVIAGLRALGAWTNERWEPNELASVALSVERDRLGINAVPSDHLLQATGSAAVVDCAELNATVVAIPSDWTIFVAWAPGGDPHSDTGLRSVQRRFARGDVGVQKAISELVAQAGAAATAINERNMSALGTAINQTFEVRTSILDVDPRQRELVDIGRQLGAAVNCGITPGAIVGLARDPGDINAIRDAYQRAGAHVVRVT